MLIRREGTKLETVYVRRRKDNGGRSRLAKQSIHTGEKWRKSGVWAGDHSELGEHMNVNSSGH